MSISADAAIAAVFVGSLAATIGIMLAVGRGWLDRADRRLLDAVRIRRPLRADGKPRRLVTAARDLMAVGGDTVRLLFLAACVAGLLSAHRGATAGLLIAISVSARAALFIIKRIVRRARPDAEAHGVVTYTTSFPSGHTFMTVIVFLSAALLIPNQAAHALSNIAIGFALLASLAIGATRVAFGVHWPSDIAAGWTAAIAWTSGCLLIAPVLA